MLVDASGKPVGDALPERAKPSGVVEVVRSFSYKLNMGNDEHGRPTYESADFFCCPKAQCAPEDQEAGEPEASTSSVWKRWSRSIRVFRERRARKQAGPAACGVRHERDNVDAAARKANGKRQHGTVLRPYGSWTGGLNDAGYGILRIDGHLERAHRISYLEFIGPIP